MKFLEFLIFLHKDLKVEKLSKVKIKIIWK